MPRTAFAVTVLLGALATLGIAQRARADLSACGDIHVEAEAKCEVIAPGVECTGKCTPVSVRAACAAKLEASCTGGCDELPSVDCQGECTGGCEARCDKLEPGEFDCQADCSADCSGSCEGNCEASKDAAQCEASCQASCDVHCQGSCDVDLPQADCSADCEASCKGSCDVDANLDCEADCQAMGFADCETEVQGGCDVACKSEGGALFCDGQYVDHGDHLQECVDALKAALNIEVETHAEAACSGNACQASASAKITPGNVCAASPSRRSTGSSVAWLPLLLVLAARTRRRRALRRPPPRP